MGTPPTSDSSGARSKRPTSCKSAGTALRSIARWLTAQPPGGSDSSPLSRLNSRSSCSSSRRLLSGLKTLLAVRGVFSLLPISYPPGQGAEDERHAGATDHHEQEALVRHRSLVFEPVSSHSHSEVRRPEVDSELRAWREDLAHLQVQGVASWQRLDSQ